MGKDITRPDYDYADGISLHLFNIKDKAEATVYGTDSKAVLNVNVEKNGDTLRIFLDKLPNNARAVLRNIASVKSVKGAEAESCSLGTQLVLNAKEVTIEL